MRPSAEERPSPVNSNDSCEWNPDDYPLQSTPSTCWSTPPFRENYGHLYNYLYLLYYYKKRILRLSRKSLTNIFIQFRVSVILDVYGKELDLRREDPRQPPLPLWPSIRGHVTDVEYVTRHLQMEFVPLPMRKQ